MCPHTHFFEFILPGSKTRVFLGSDLSQHDMYPYMILLIFMGTYVKL